MAKKKPTTAWASYRMLRFNCHPPRDNLQRADRQEPAAAELRTGVPGEVSSMFGFFKRRRRKRLRAAPFPAAWLEIIERNVRFYACLPDADRHELQGLVQIFLAEKTFEGCGGLELTDEIKVTIAAQACLLLLHRQTDVYPRLVTILVYPSAYVAKGIKPIGGPIVLEGESARLGRVVDQRSRRSIMA